MSADPIFLGENKIVFQNNEVKGSFVQIENEEFYKIENSNALRPFFMSIVSNSNHWLFIASNGGISAGRKDCDIALFPYYTDDKIIESSEITGSKTILLVHKNGKRYLWEPFSDRNIDSYKIQRNLYKSKYGNKIIFEEINLDLKITFKYQWSTSNLYGFVKKSTIVNNSNASSKIEVVDGIQNILPFGVNADLQNSKSNLVDAYKKNELQAKQGLGIYSLSSIIVDNAEPSEALKATTVWSYGFKKPTHLISSIQLNNVRKGIAIKQETDIRAEKGAYFIKDNITLQKSNSISWYIVANVNQGSTSIAKILSELTNKEQLINNVLNDVENGTQNLIDLCASADGLQCTKDNLKTTRHFSNVLFNCMRGGVFDENDVVDVKDFLFYLKKKNDKIYNNHIIELQNTNSFIQYKGLCEIAKKSKDLDFIRLTFEYLPLKFSRRHGDPSRPWNKFSIQTQSEIDGSKILNYEGNWRDIFQNWEALAHSYPAFIEGMIFKFLNASTFDGYNPFRINKYGIDWEVIEPDNPWSYIGYWGDHQLIYLLKFLEFCEKFYPQKLTEYFTQNAFVYANVPYKIKNYNSIIDDPKNTIIFDKELDAKIRQRVLDFGTDGALLLTENGESYKVNFIEKLLATTLSKVANLIPEAGIWMNTQRPEWNDANNALVGNGASMVTLYYLRRFLLFFDKITNNITVTKIEISDELTVFFNDVVKVLEQNITLLNNSISDKNRKTITDGLGVASSNYRTQIYKHGFKGNKYYISKNELKNFLKLALKYIEHSINNSEREDKLYQSYNLIEITNNKISIVHLNEMLEGQVAILSSEYLSSKKSLELLQSLRKSKLYREDQNSYLLYPDKNLLRFVDKNIIPKKEVEQSELLKTLLKNKNHQIIEKDYNGNYHFNPNFNNVNSLKSALEELTKAEYKDLILKEKHNLEIIFENVFNHKFFTGRSGTFFGYEGLGSIYWHMVSKLQLAVQEVYFNAEKQNESESIKNELRNHYYEISEGIGVHKSPKKYGAFPIDPYSHTPANKGAQQPGMTGQVKEDVLSRLGELGVLVSDGKLQFKPSLLKQEEFLSENSKFKYIDVNQQRREILLTKNTLCFLYCQVPIIYHLSEKNSIEINENSSSKEVFNKLILDKNISNQIFERTGTISNIHVYLNIRELQIN
ncbi:MAG: hypothetical protein R3342_12830 [Lutibacter sp.]|uniref:hypothetical protein n=1 Tax=Lutibacter sp. TaxID=1925666 RepID=UPI00299D2FB1|nr:hypothetical protein [Lutibacter sp.]MDX1830418.1 hypothetical protein [Lutibacter sp.]